jgi:hypothetical protein
MSRFEVTLTVWLRAESLEDAIELEEKIIDLLDDLDEVSSVGSGGVEPSPPEQAEDA